MRLFQSTMTLAAVTVIALSAPGIAAAETATPAIQAEALGKCLVKSDRSNALSIFGRLPADNSAIDPAVLQGGAGAACANDVTSVTPMQVRGAIAEALYERDFREAGLTPHQPIANLARLDLPEGTADTTGIYALGRCVARARFANVDKLFAMRPGSQPEANFIDMLMPYFAACQPRGTQIAIKRSDIRSLIAQSAYAGNVRYWLNQAPAAR